jgi:hypothetical protein
MKATHTPPTHVDPTDVDPTPADILRGAAQYLQLHGWHQGSNYATGPHTLTPPACALGAIGMATFGHRIPDDQDHRADWRHFQRASDALDDYLTLNGAKTTIPELPEQYGDCASVGDWNDAPGRTVGEVITALEAAADEWDRQHTIPAGDGR